MKAWDRHELIRCFRCLSCILMVPVLAWVWLAARDPAYSVFNGAVHKYVLSGEIFRDRFNTIHAGFTMDQPTIGKWLFWFTFMSVTSMPLTLLVRLLTDRECKWSWLIFAIANVVICICLICMLSWPLIWLGQYIHSMGFTPRRVLGLLYAGVAGAGVLGFFAWSIRRPSREQRDAPRPGTVHD